MTSMSESALMKEAITLLYRRLGPEKAIRFLRLSGIVRGDSVEEIEDRTKDMGEQEAVEFILTHGRRHLRQHTPK